MQGPEAVRPENPLPLSDESRMRVKEIKPIPRDSQKEESPHSSLLPFPQTGAGMAVTAEKVTVGLCSQLWGQIPALALSSVTTGRLLTLSVPMGLCEVK